MLSLAAYGTTYNNRQATLRGNVTNGDPSQASVVMSGVVNGTARPNPDGTWSHDFTNASLGLVQVRAFRGNEASPLLNVNLMAIPPQITSFHAIEDLLNCWEFRGTVAGPYPAGLVVTLTSTGCPSVNGQTATVQADGSFSTTIQLLSTEKGTVSAKTVDSWGQPSNVMTDTVNPT